MNEGRLKRIVLQIHVSDPPSLVYNEKDYMFTVVQEDPEILPTYKILKNVIGDFLVEEFGADLDDEEVCLCCVHIRHMELAEELMVAQSPSEHVFRIRLCPLRSFDDEGFSPRLRRRSSIRQGRHLLLESNMI